MLDLTEYKSKIPKLEKKINNNNFTTPAGKALSGQPLCTRLRSVFLTFEALKAKKKMAKKDMSTRTMSNKFAKSRGRGENVNWNSGCPKQ